MCRLQPVTSTRPSASRLTGSVANFQFATLSSRVAIFASVNLNHQKRHADWFCAPQDEMASIYSRALVYTAGRGDTGKRTSSLRRGYTPDQKRSVLLTAPQQVELGASRVGCA